MTHFNSKLSLILFLLIAFIYSSQGQDEYCFADSMYEAETFSLPRDFYNGTNQSTNFIVLKDGKKGFFAIETTRRKVVGLVRYFDIKGNAEIILDNGEKIKLIDRRYISGLIPVPNDLTSIDCDDLVLIDIQRKAIMSNNGLLEISNVFKLTEREIELLKQHRIARVTYTIMGLKYFGKAKPSMENITVFNAFLEEEKLDTRKLFYSLF